ncbi:MAG TPA: O-antigen ligase family protein [Thermoanaerobaculia bacterium]
MPARGVSVSHPGDPYNPSNPAFALLLLFALLTPVISAAYVVVILLLLAWIVSVRRRGALPETLRAPVTLVAGLLAAFTVLSTIFSREPAVSARHVAGVLLLLLLPITMDLVDSAARARWLLLTLSAGGVILAVIGIWQFLHGGDDLNNRIRGTLSHYMTFSGIAMAAACLLLGFALEGPGRWRLVGLLGALPLAAVLLTFTRNAYVGLVAALLVYLVVRRPRGLLLLAPALLAVFLLAPPEIRGRIRSIADLSDSTNRDRIAMVRAGSRIVTQYPIFGLGPDMISRYYPLYRDDDALHWRVPHLHNNVIQIAAANGLFAAASYVALVALFLSRAVVLLRRERRPERAAIWSAVLLAGTALTVAGLFEYNFGDTEVEMAALLIFAVPFARFAGRPASTPAPATLPVRESA